MDKKTVICINGSLCTKHLWHHQVQHLHDTYDFIFPRVMGVDNVQDIAHNILQNAPKTFIIAGMSAGVPIAFAVVRALLAKNALQRLEKIILIAGNPYSLHPEKQQSLENAKRIVRKHGLRHYAQTVLSQYISKSNPNNKTICQAIVNMAMTFDEGAYTLHLDMLKNRPCSLDTLKHIACPVLAISGEDDTLCPPTLHEQMTQAVKNGTHIRLKNTGHYINLENPSSVSTHMQTFLNT